MNYCYIIAILLLYHSCITAALLHWCLCTCDYTFLFTCNCIFKSDYLSCAVKLKKLSAWNVLSMMLSY